MTFPKGGSRGANACKWRNFEINIMMATISNKCSFIDRRYFWLSRRGEGNYHFAMTNEPFVTLLVGKGVWYFHFSEWKTFCIEFCMAPNWSPAKYNFGQRCSFLRKFITIKYHKCIFPIGEGCTGSPPACPPPKNFCRPHLSPSLTSHIILYVTSTVPLPL